MVFEELFSQISLLTILMCTLLIYTLTLLASNEKNSVRLMGLSFIIPLTYGIVSYLINQKPLSIALLHMGQIVMLMYIFIVLALKLKTANFAVARNILYLIPFLIFIPLVSIPAAADFTESSGFILAGYIVTAVPIMYLLRNEKYRKSLIFWSMPLILAGNAFPFVFTGISFITWFSLLMLIIGYILLLRYFYLETIVKLKSKFSEVENKVTEIDRTVAIEVKKRTVEVEHAKEKLAVLAKTDSMTNVLNKGGIVEVLENHMNTSTKRGFSILMFDIDKFKKINDTMGHIVGDKCIKRLALATKNMVRENDAVGRYGGDEFIIYLNGTGTGDAKVIAERMRKRIEEFTEPSFTVSIGIATYPVDGVSAKTLIEAADEGLYSSKKKGGNSVAYRNT